MHSIGMDFPGIRVRPPIELRLDPERAFDRPGVCGLSGLHADCNQEDNEWTGGNF